MNTRRLKRAMARIAVCAPATPITRAHGAALLALVADEFPQHGITLNDQCFAVDGHFAGSDALRLEALLDCAHDPDIDAVWFAKGGYGSNRIAEAAIANMGPAARGKQYLGFSDCGYLLAALYKEKIGGPVHAPMPVSVLEEGGKAAMRRVLRFLDGNRAGIETSIGREPVVAFNLTTLAMLVGTPLMPDLNDHVVLVEEVSEHLYAIDRLFFHIMPHLVECTGLRMGRFSSIPENDRPFGKNVEEIAKYWCARSGVAFLGDADIGHDTANAIVPFGLASGQCDA